ncbi:NADH dehydrogenase (ubiquinone) B15 subunit isoform X1 [Colletes latitarsis]|uniref:NADH dehydrogenase (ubiquinone) B15 subunit isoform X1 n=1 Tax=Colletes latitarsis TaxID=2605962 RepID=UPI004036A7B7
MASSKIKLYDLSAKTREVLEWRNAKRKTLREQYLRQILHPTKQQLVSDDAVKRYATMRLTQEFQVMLTGKSFITYFGTLLGVIIGISQYITSVKKTEEKRIRMGLVRYADRPVKIL